MIWQTPNKTLPPINTPVLIYIQTYDEYKIGRLTSEGKWYVGIMPLSDELISSWTVIDKPYI